MDNPLSAAEQTMLEHSLAAESWGMMRTDL